MVVSNGVKKSHRGRQHGVDERGEGARIYFVNAGLNSESSFHPIGSHWDTTYREAALLNTPLRGLSMVSPCVTSLPERPGSSVVRWQLSCLPLVTISPCLLASPTEPHIWQERAPTSGRETSPTESRCAMPCPAQTACSTSPGYIRLVYATPHPCEPPTSKALATCSKRWQHWRFQRASTPALWPSTRIRTDNWSTSHTGSRGNTSRTTTRPSGKLTTRSPDR